MHGLLILLSPYSFLYFKITPCATHTSHSIPLSVSFLIVTTSLVCTGCLVSKFFPDQCFKYLLYPLFHYHRLLSLIMYINNKVSSSQSLFPNFHSFSHSGRWRSLATNSRYHFSIGLN